MKKSRRAFLTFSFMALACAAPALAQVQPLPPVPRSFDGLVIGGRFDIRYNPLMCIRAPCPPGRYSVTLDGQRIGEFRSLILVRTIDGQAHSTRFEGRSLNSNGGIEGLLRVEDGEAYIDLWPQAGEAEER